MSSEVIEISIDQIKPNKYQPRKDFNEEAIFDLAQSIRTNGLIQPVVVRKKNRNYEIIAGERRYRACIMAGLTVVPCVIKEADDQTSAELALIENVQRENLSAIEEAKAYMNILKEGNYTQEELAEKMGKAQSTIANKMRLLDLSPKIQQAVNEKKITERHARALLNVEVSKRNRVLNRIIKKEMTVKETEEYIDKLNHPEEKEVKKKIKTRGFSRNQQIAVNTIHQAIDMCKKMGIHFSVEETESEKDHSIIIRFPHEDQE